MDGEFLSLDATYLIYAGAAGILAGLFFFVVFFSRRIRWLIRVLGRKEAASPGLISSVWRICLICIWTAAFLVLLFLGFFLHTYHTFTHEEPVARVVTHPLERHGGAPLTFLAMTSFESGRTRYFFVRGEQWVIEADFLKWKPWVGFLGLRPRYRLTRLHGRYRNTREEKRSPRSVHSLVSEERQPLWRYLYRYGQELPIVDTVYGSAAFHFPERAAAYTVYVGPSGLLLREMKR